MRIRLARSLGDIRVIARYSYYQSRYRIGMSTLNEIREDPLYDRPISFLIGTAALTMCKIRHIQRFEYKQTVER